MAGNANENNKGATSASHMRLVASADLEISEDEFEILKSTAATATVTGGPRAQAIPNAQESGDHEPEDDDENEEEDMEEDEDDDDIESLSDLERHAEEYDDGHLWSVLAEACTPEESQSYRQLLRDAGPVEFIRMTIENDSITAKKLLTAFGVRPPALLEGQPDESYYGVLSVAMSRELSKRVKLKHFNTVDDAVMLISHARNIIVLTGAGISTSLGIPDFRSKGGLYSKLEHLNLNDPQEVFDITLFKEDPSIFYTIARDILPSGDKFTPTHKFIYLLQQKGKLLTNYSQNIDNIEAIAGILPEKLIQCHGSFATASCVQCHYKVPLDPQSSLYKTIKAGEIPKCEECTKRRLLLKAPVMKRKRSQNGQDKKRKKFDRDADSSEDEAYDHPSIGVMKPDITFFGEALPDTFSDRLTKHDKHKVDLVIVIGTSLKVAPVSEVIPYLPPGIPQMYISREPVAHVNFDIDLLGDCDVVVAELCRRLGWDLDHEMVPPGQVVSIELAPDTVSRHLFTEQKQEQ